MIKPKVLFLCSTNSSRTQMAEGFLRRMAGEQFEVFSAGGDPGEASPAAIAVMKEVGIDIAAHTPKDVADFFDDRFTFVVHLCDREKERSCPIFPGAIYRLMWDLENPKESPSGIDIATREVRDQIRHYVNELSSCRGKNEV